MLPLLSLKSHDGQQTDGFLFRGKRKVAPPSAPEPAPEPSPEQDALAARVVQKMMNVVADRKERGELRGFKKLVADKLHADDLERAKELCGVAGDAVVVKQ